MFIRPFRTRSERPTDHTSWRHRRDRNKLARPFVCKILEERLLLSTLTQLFQDGVGGYEGTQDARIKLSRPEKNYGATVEMQLDGDPDRATLLRWDTGSIASASTVVSASITIHVTDASRDTYELYELRRPWLENEVTWNEFASGSPWEIAGGQGSDDVGTIAVGQTTSDVNGLMSIELNAAGVAMVQSWINDPRDNQGVFFQDYDNATRDGLKFDSHERDIVDRRPMLSVTYVQGTAPPVTSPPEAVDDVIGYSVVEGGTLTADDPDGNGTPSEGSDDGVLANDTDPDGDALRAILVSEPAHGTLMFNGNGAFTYQHDGSETSSDSFSYRASDGKA